MRPEAPLGWDSTACAAYRDGFADALRWVFSVFNLDTEDQDELNRVLAGGDCEGMLRKVGVLRGQSR